MGATNQPIFSFQPTRPVLIYVKFKKMTGGNVRSMKQVIHVIGAAIFDRCADVCFTKISKTPPKDAPKTGA
jgi:hypothetical protein